MTDVLRGECRGVVESLLKVFKDRLVSVALFGSRARGDYKPWSDYDFLIVLEGPIDRGDREVAYSALADFRRRMGCDTTVLLVSFENLVKNIGFSTLLNAVYDSVILYDRDGRFQRVKEKLLSKLREIGIERKGAGWTLPRKRIVPFRIELNDDPVKEYGYRLKLARRNLRIAEEEFRRGNYPETIHYAQLCIENSAKALISLFKPPPWYHDVSGELLDLIEEEKTLRKYSDSIRRIAEIVKSTADLHGLSTYGDADRLLTPEEIFTREDAEEILEKARQVLKEIERITTLIIDEVGIEQEKHKVHHVNT